MSILSITFVGAALLGANPQAVTAQGTSELAAQAPVQQANLCACTKTETTCTSTAINAGCQTAGQTACGQNTGCQTAGQTACIQTAGCQNTGCQKGEAAGCLSGKNAGCENGTGRCGHGRSCHCRRCGLCRWCPWLSRAVYGDCDGDDCNDDCDLHCWDRYILTYCVGPGDFYPHFPYPPVYHGYYYFRPYNFTHVVPDAAFAEQIGDDPRAPYNVAYARSFFPPAPIIDSSTYVPQKPYPLLEDLLQPKPAVETPAP